jgi:WD40 repeat protein
LAFVCGKKWKEKDYILRSLEDHEGDVNVIAFSPDGSMVATGGSDGKAISWDVVSGTASGEFYGGPRRRGPRRRMIKQDGPDSRSIWSLAYAPEGGTLATGSRDGTIRLWDLNSGSWGGTELAVFSNLDPHSVWSMAFSPNGRYLVTGHEDGAVRVWDPRGFLGDGEDTPPVAVLEAHSSSIWSVAFSPDQGTALATAGKDRRWKLWDHGGRAKNFEEICSGGHSDWVTAVAFSPDFESLFSASQDELVFIWRVGAAYREERHCPLKPVHMRASAGIWSIAVSFDSKIVATGHDDGTATVWEVQGTKNVMTISGHSGPVRSVALDPLSQTLATGSGDGRAKLWNIRNINSGTWKRKTS